MRPPWSVLVLFGASGTGKSTAAASIGRQYGVTWLQVDDLRLTLQYSRARLPERTDQLYFFDESPDVWTRTPADLRQAFIDVAEIMVPAVRTVIHSHVLTGSPMVIEGDGILPALVFDPLLRPLVADGTIRFCCVGTPSEDELLSNLVSRGRGVDPSMPHKHRRQAAANKAFGAWLEEESARLGIPVVHPYPFETLPTRILDAVSRV
jgi:2-phosphoglycerate kinase